MNDRFATKIKTVSNLAYIELQKHRSLNNVNTFEHRKIFSYALALVISRHLPLPSAPVESVSAYFIANCEEMAREISGYFNENIVIDYDVVRDFAQKLWNIRYFAVHAQHKVPSFYPFDFFATITGVGNYIDEKTYAYVNEYKVQIIDLSNAITDLAEISTQ